MMERLPANEMEHLVMALLWSGIHELIYLNYHQYEREVRAPESELPVVLTEGVQGTHSAARTPTTRGDGEGCVFLPSQMETDRKTRIKAYNAQQIRKSPSQQGRSSSSQENLQKMGGARNQSIAHRDLGHRGLSRTDPQAHQKEQ